MKELGVEKFVFLHQKGKKYLRFKLRLEKATAQYSLGA